MRSMSATEADTRALLEPLLARPARCAVLCDVDGTLAPIVDRPQDAAVPEETTRTLRALAERFALVGCVSGRRATEARRLVAVAELAYIGNQGLERLAPGAEEPTTDPAVAGRGAEARELLAGLDWERLGRTGVRQEDKGPIQVLHWRGAADSGEAQAEVVKIAALAQDAGLYPLWGRKVLELRPVAGIDKGSATQLLLEEHAPLEAALFAGDDRTDLDAFRALRAMAEGPRLGTAVCVGVDSPEGPKELAAETDLIVAGTEGVLEILRALAE